MAGPVQVADDFGGVQVAPPTAPPPPAAGPAEVQDDFGGVRAMPAQQAPTAGSLRDTYEAVKHIDPEQQAEVAKVASQTGVPENVVAMDPKGVAATQPPPELQMLPSHAPRLARWLSEPGNMIVAKDDLPTLSAIERHLTGWPLMPAGMTLGAEGYEVPEGYVSPGGFQAPTWWQAWQKGWAQLKLDFQRTAQHLGVPPEWSPAFQAETMTARGEEVPLGLRQMEAEKQATLAAAAREIEAKGILAQVWVRSFQAAPFVLGAAATGEIGGAAAMTGFGAAAIYGPVREQLGALKGPEGRELTPAEKTAIAAPTAIVAGAAQAVSLGKWVGTPLMRAVPGQMLDRVFSSATLPAILAKFGLRWGAHDAAGAAGMAVAGAVQDLALDLAAHRVEPNHEIDAGRVADRMWESFESNLRDFALLSGLGAGRQMLHDVGVSRASRQQADQIQALATQLKDSKLLERDPEGAKQLLSQIVPGSSILVDRGAWDSYWQAKRIDPAAKAAEIASDGGKAYAAAQQSDGLVALPLDAYLAKLGKTEHVLGLAADSKLTPDARTPREEAAFQQQDQRLVDEARKARGAQFEADKRKIVETIQKAAENLPQVSKEEVEAVATLVAENVGTLSLRTGLPMTEMASLMGLSRLRFAGGAGEQVARVAQMDLRSQLSPEAAAVIDGARAGDRRAQQRLEAMAYQDPLTGLLNVQAFQDYRRNRAPTGWDVAVDANDLKAQDVLGGHDVGDAMLRSVADAMRKASEATGGAGRLYRRGGDEFHAGGFKTQAEAQAFAKALQGALKGGAEVAKGFKVSAALGVGPDIESADAALYEAKGAKVAKVGAYEKGKAETITPELGAGESFMAMREARGAPLGERYLTEVGGKPVTAKLEQPAYHGTAVRGIAKFATDFIGTGQGAQSYGWGLYFAERRAVAEAYRRELTEAGPPRLTIAGKEVSTEGPTTEFWATEIVVNRDLAHEIQRRQVDYHEEPTRAAETAISKMRQEWSANRDGYEKRGDAKSVAYYRHGLQYLDSLHPAEVRVVRQEKKGQVYRVDLPEKSHLLDWDAPLIDQPDRILRQLEAAGVIPSGFREYRDAWRAVEAITEEPVKGTDLAKRTARYDAAAASLAEAGRRIAADQTAEVKLPDPSRVGIHDLTGSWLHSALVERSLAAGGQPISVGSAYEWASRRLARAGIPGLMYLDQGSRQAGEGTHNFVIWNDQAVKVLGTLYQQGRAGPRGVVRMRLDATGRPIDFPVELFANADVSTLAHEVGGHFLSWAMHDAAVSEKGAALRRDYDALIKWAGYDSPEQRLAENLERADLESRASLEPAEAARLKALQAKEERIGHGFEQYLAEGKAPTAALARPFAKMRTWLLRIYRSLFGIGEQYRQHYGQELGLSDEVRGVFDRWFAAEAEVGKQEASPESDALLRLLEPADRAALLRAREERRAEAEGTVYQTLKQAEQAEHKDVRQKIRQEVAAEVAERPVWKLIDYLKREKTPEAGLVDVALGNLAPDLLDQSGRPWRLDRTEIVEQYGEGVLKELPRGATVAKGGAPADYIAERFGYPNGEEMVKALRGAGNREAVIDGRTQDRMRELYPSMADDPQAVVQAAIEAEHSPEAAEEALVGARILVRRVDPALGLRLRVMEDAKARKATAERLVSETRIADLSPASFLQRERRAAREAVELTTKALGRDTERRKEYAARAMDARDVQLLNMALWRAARDRLISLESGHDYLQSFTRDDMRRRIGKATSAEEGPDGKIVVTQPFLDRMDDLLASIDFRQSGAPAGRAQRFKKWLDAQPPDVQEDVRSRISDKQIADLERPPRHWKDFTVKEFEGLVGAAEMIEAQANLKKKLRFGQADIDREEGIAKFLDEIKERYRGGLLKLVPRAESGEVLRGKARGLLYVGRRAEHLAEQLGPTFTRLYWDPISDSQTEWYRLEREVAGPILDSIKEVSTEARAFLRKKFVVQGQPLDGEAISAIALNWGNDSNRQKTLRGFAILKGKELRGIPSLSPEGVQEALSHLTRPVAELVQKTWDQESSKWQEMADLEKRHTGLAPPKIEPLPFDLTLADGSTFHFRGGYHGMDYDFRFSTAAQRTGERIEQGVGALAFEGQRAVTPQGHLQARIESFARPVELSIVSVPRHITETMKDLAMRDALISSRDFITDGRVRDAISDAIGPEGYQMLLTHWRQSANGAASIPGSPGILNRVRSAAVGATIAWNIPVALQHLTNPIPTFTKVPVKFLFPEALKFAPILGEEVARALASVPARYLGPAVQRFATGRAELLDEVYNLSPYMKETWAFDEAETNIGRAMSGLTLRVGRFTRASERIRDLGMLPIRYITKVSAGVGWTGAFEHATAPQAEGGLGMEEGEAIKHADSVVRMTQTSYRNIDRSISETHPVWKYFTAFSGYLNSQFNLLVNTNAEARRAWAQGDRAAALSLVAKNYGIIIASGVLAGLLVGKGPHDSDGDGEISEKDWAEWIALESIIYPLSTAPVVRPAIEGALGQRSRDVSLTPWMGVATAAARTVRETRAAMSEKATGVELPRAGLAALETLGWRYGLPVAQLRRTGGFWADITPEGLMESPEAQQASPAEAAYGTVYGPKRSGRLGEAIWGK